jgi:hypothetical protein
LAALERVRAVEGLELGGAVGDSVVMCSVLGGAVGQGRLCPWLGCREGLADGVGDVAGEDVRAVFVVDVREGPVGLPALFAFPAVS